MHGLFCLCSLVLVFFLFPETKGIPLEEMDAVFGEELVGEEDTETTSLLPQGDRTLPASANHDNLDSGGNNRRGLSIRRWWNRPSSSGASPPPYESVNTEQDS